MKKKQLKIESIAKGQNQNMSFACENIYRPDKLSDKTNTEKKISDSATFPNNILK